MYGTQANDVLVVKEALFENDVKMYGTQAKLYSRRSYSSLRMM